MADSDAVKNNIFIGEGVIFTGSINAPGKVTIHGKVNGEVVADDLQIGRAGHVSGKVRAREMDIYGELHEDITCQHHLLIHSTGKVSGNLDYSELEIERGGQFRGAMNQRLK